MQQIEVYKSPWYICMILGGLWNCTILLQSHYHLLSTRSMRYVCNSRSDISFSIGLVSRYMSEPKVSHMKAVKRILRYLKGSINYEILFPRDSESKKTMVTCYSNA